jgi:hypothetical protein
MKVRILDVAEADLLSGFRFYEWQSSGAGWYFLDTLAAVFGTHSSAPPHPTLHTLGYSHSSLRDEPRVPHASDIKQERTASTLDRRGVNP